MVQCYDGELNTYRHKKATPKRGGFLICDAPYTRYYALFTNYSAACSINKFKMSDPALATDVPGPKIATAPAW